MLYNQHSHMKTSVCSFRPTVQMGSRWNKRPEDLNNNKNLDKPMILISNTIYTEKNCKKSIKVVQHNALKQECENITLSNEFIASDVMH